GRSTYSLWGAQAAGLLVTAARRRELPCRVFATDLKLGRFPSPSSLTLAGLHSMSLIPSAPFTDLHGSIGFVSIRVHSWLQLALRPVASSDSRRADQRNHLAFVPAVNEKILVGCDHAVMRIKFTHPNETKIRQIGLPIRVALGQVRQLRQMIIAIEREAHQLVADHL